MNLGVQEFKVNRFLTSMLALFSFALLVSTWIFNEKFEAAKFDVYHIVPNVMFVIFLAVAVYGHYFIRLFISKEGIRLEDRLFGWLSYEYSWQEVDAISTQTNALNKQRQFFLYSTETKVLKGLNPLLFTPVEGKQFIEPFTLKENLFGTKQATAIERAIQQHVNEIKTMKLAEVRRLMAGSSVDLGKEAGFFAAISGIMFTIGTVLLVLGDSKHMLLQPAYYWIGMVVLLAVVLSVKIIPSEKKLAAVFIAPLFSFCCAWVFVQSMHFYTLKATEPHVIDYYLYESQNIYQVWRSEGLPDIEIYSDPGNLKYEEVEISQSISIHVGPIGFYDVPRNVINNLFKNSQTLL